MSRDWVVPIFFSVIFVLVLLMLLIIDVVSQEPCPQAMPEKTHLPSLCKQYYNDGTDAWIECMGVGRK